MTPTANGALAHTQMLRLPDVRRLTGLSTSTIYGRMRAGTFPQSVRLGVRSVGWRDTDIAEWLEAINA